MAWPELLCVVMTWDMMVVMRIVLSARVACVSVACLDDKLEVALCYLAYCTRRHINEYILLPSRGMTATEAYHDDYSGVRRKRTSIQISSESGWRDH